MDSSLDKLDGKFYLDADGVLEIEYEEEEETAILEGKNYPPVEFLDLSIISSTTEHLIVKDFQKLEGLYIKECPELVSIRLEGMTSLKDLGICGDSNIESLDTGDSPLSHISIEEAPLKRLVYGSKDLVAFSVSGSTLENLDIHGDKLKTLGLCNNNISKCPEFFTNAPLVSLNLENNVLKEFGGRYMYLENLRLESNKIKKFNPNPGDFAVLRHLDISYNSIKSFCLDSNVFPNLSSINLSGNPLGEIVIKGFFKNIERIQVSTCNLRQFIAPNNFPKVNPPEGSRFYIDLRGNKYLEFLDINFDGFIFLDSQKVSFVNPGMETSLYSNVGEHYPVKVRKHSLGVRDEIWKLLPPPIAEETAPEIQV